jgi:hypothetical protein
MMLGTCQINDIDKSLTYLRDERQFGNTSEKQFSTSALDYIAAPTRLLNENGVIRGFDITGIPSSLSNTLFINGGEAIVNGKIIQTNAQSISVPIIAEAIGNSLSNPNYTITWFHLRE